MRVILLILVILAGWGQAAAAQDLERETQGELEGEVETESVATSGDAETVVVLEGEGTLEGGNQLSAGSEGLEHEIGYSLEASEEESLSGHMLKTLTLTAGVRVEPGQLYVSQVEAEKGGRADLAKQMNVTAGEGLGLAEGGEIDITKAAVIESGIYQRHIDLSNEEQSLRETLRAAGVGSFMDLLTMNWAEPEQEPEVE